jgi:hypothetical protein
MFGYVCYPQYFPLLEGWFHHLATGCATLYYLNHPKRVLYCMTQVIEASTILLSLFKVLYDVPWVLRLRDQWFARLFVLFRVVLPSLVLALFYSLLFDGVAMGVFAAHMVLNLYWLCKIANK